MSNYGVRVFEVDQARLDGIQEHQHRRRMRELAGEAAELDNKKRALEIRKLQIDIKRVRGGIRRP